MTCWPPCPTVGKYARIQVNNLSNVPSDYMDPARWVQLTQAVQAALARPEVAGAIVSHGTDTLEETAFWLDLTVQSSKPIVLIGAQRNASVSDFDGPRNLLNAVRIAVDPKARDKGAMLAMNNQINAARYVTKTHTANVETFRSGEFGFLGEVYPDRVNFASAPARRQHLPIQAQTMPEVEIFPMYGGANGQAVRQAVDRGVKGIVIDALGMGNMNVAMLDAAKYAIGKNVPVVVSTRVHNGRVMPSYGFEGGGKTSFEAGAVMADDLRAPKARIPADAGAAVRRDGAEGPAGSIRSIVRPIGRRSPPRRPWPCAAFLAGTEVAHWQPHMPTRAHHAG